MLIVNYLGGNAQISIEQIIDCGLISDFISFLQTEKPNLQLEVVKIMRNMVFGSHLEVRNVLRYGME